MVTKVCKSSISTSLIDVLEPQKNQWLSELAPDKTDLPIGVRVIRHQGSEVDHLERNERLRKAKRKLLDWNES